MESPAGLNLANPSLIACSHGTRSAAGQLVVRDLLKEVEARLGVPVFEAFVDVQSPHIRDVAAQVAGSHNPSAVVVPVLLAGGYHVHVDIAEAVASHPQISATPALGPDARLVEVLLQRVAELGVANTSTLVMTAAGSSDPRAQADAQVTLEMLRQHWPGKVELAYAAGIAPRVQDVVAEVQARGETAVIASYLLAPGFFQDRLYQAGASAVTAPLAPHPLIVDIITARFCDAVNQQ